MVNAELRIDVPQDWNLDVYILEGGSILEIVKSFRKLIGRSYIPPKFAFGFGQSRWGYQTKEDFRQVAEGYRKNHIPLDMIYMDIDYMQNYKDFTFHEENFWDFSQFVQEMKDQKVRLIPIIDAGVKIEDGYTVYEEGVKNRYFCQREDGSDFVAAVWPGYTHFPDVLNPEARKWFGDQYQVLMDQGIEGFWNDMNEPAIFYTPEGIEKVSQKMKTFLDDPETNSPWDVKDALEALSGSQEDYRAFYHQVEGQRILHDKIHNLFGYHMTRAAGEAFERIAPDRRFLMFSRSSYIGMHRYGGIWTGDNKSWWSHILLNLKMMPSLNMCVFLYVGADLGGFGADATRDLVLRWLALGVFTPLMRNHSAIHTRDQECFRFENVEDFRHVVGVRYRLLPYLYSEYIKAALNDEMYFRPLAFDYPEDAAAREVEDQLMLGDGLMIAPVYLQNASGRCVYLPEDMLFVKFLPDGTLHQEPLSKGLHRISAALNEVPLFIKKNHILPLAAFAETVAALDETHLELIGWITEPTSYTLYQDDGLTKDYSNPQHYLTLTKEPAKP